MTEDLSAQSKYSQHAIQLISLEVLQLHLERDPSRDDKDQVIDKADFQLGHGHSEYDVEERKIGVKLIAELGYEDDSDLPFKIKVELLGIFSVDESKFPIDKITHWASKNAPLILYPYLRENVYALSAKTGHKGLLLPLFEVPSFKLN